MAIGIRRNKALATAAVAMGALVLTACSSASDTGSGDTGGRGSVNDNAQEATLCQPFQGAVEPNKTPAPTPEGDPSTPATLTAVKQQVLNSVEPIDKTAQYCAEGTDTMELCNKAYWHDSYSQVPPGVPTAECNFFYLRVSDQFWHQPTRIVIDEYGDYLGLHADGTDAENAKVGPHTTLVEQGDADTFFEKANRGAYAQLPLDSSGNLVPSGVTDAVTAVTKATDGSGARSGSTPPQPLLASDQMTADCANVWEYRGQDPTPQPVENFKVASDAAFLCAIDAGDQGTAYARVTLGDIASDKSTVGATFDVQQAATTDALLRSPDASGSFTVGNLVWPVATSEVTSGKTEQVTIPAQCSDDTGATDQTSCVHLWVTGGKAPKYETGCKIWMTLEIDKSGVSQTLTNYGVDTSGLTAHISLAKSDSYKGDQAQMCQRAAALNTKAGLPADGAPPAYLM